MAYEDNYFSDLIPESDSEENYFKDLIPDKDTALKDNHFADLIPKPGIVSKGLSAGAKVGRQAYQSVGEGAGDAMLGLATQIEHASVLPPPHMTLGQYQEWKKTAPEMAEAVKRGDTIGKNELSDMLRTGAEAYPGVEEGRPLGVVSDWINGILHSAPSIPVIKANPVAGLMLIYEQISGGSYKQYIEEGKDEDTAFKAAQINAMINAPIELTGNALQIGKLVKILDTKGVSKALGPKVKIYLKTIFENALVEGSEELLQEQGNLITDEYANNPDADPVELANAVSKKLLTLEHAKRSGQAFGAGFGGGALMTGAGVMGRIGQDVINKKGWIGKESDDIIEIRNRITQKGIELNRAPTQKEVDQIVKDYRDSAEAEKIELLAAVNETIARQEASKPIDVLEVARGIPTREQQIVNDLEVRGTVPGFQPISGESAQESAQAFEEGLPYSEDIEEQYKRSQKGSELLKRDLALQDPYLQDIAFRIITGEQLDLTGLNEQDLRSIEYIIEQAVQSLPGGGTVPVREGVGLTTGLIPEARRETPQLLPEGQRLLPAPEPGLLPAPPTDVGPDGQFAPPRRSPISQGSGAPILMGELSKGDDPGNYTGKELRQIAKERGLEIPANMVKKSDMIEFIKADKPIETPEKLIKVQRSSEEAGDNTLYEIIEGENKGSSIVRANLKQMPEKYDVDETLMPAVAEKENISDTDLLLKDLEKLRKKPTKKAEDTVDITGGKTPQQHIRDIINNTEATEKEVLAEKKDIKGQLIAGIKTGEFDGAVRFGTMGEVKAILKQGRMPVSIEHGVIHAQPIMGKDDDFFVAYGNRHRHNMAIVFPENAMIKKQDAHTKEVLINDKVDVNDLKFLIAGHKKAYTFNELKSMTTPEQAPQQTESLAGEKVSEQPVEETPAKETEVIEKPAKEVKKADNVVLNDLNPTGGIFADYSPQDRSKMKLGDNITTLDKTMGKSPNDEITIYRGDAGNQEEIVPGDFITTNKQLAKDYAGNGKVLEKKVKLSDILDDKTEPLGEEYIYKPQETKQAPAKEVEQETKQTPGQVYLDKGGVKYFNTSREIKKGLRKGKIEVTLTNGNKVIVRPEQIRRMPGEAVFTEGADRVEESGAQYAYIPTEGKQLSFKFMTTPGPIASQHVKMSTTGYIKAAGNVVTGVSDVASLLASIRKSPQEILYTVTTDKDGVILEVHKYTKGIKAAAYVSATEAAGRILNVKGARTAYIVHNHPSGKTEPSQPDRDSIEHISSLLKSGNVITKGLIIGNNSFRDLEVSNARPIKPALRKVLVPVKERTTLIKGKAIEGGAVSNSYDAIELLNSGKFGDDSGALLLDNESSKPIAFVPFIKGQSMKQTTADIVRFAEHTNSNAIILRNNSKSENVKEYIDTLHKGGLGDMKILDTIENGKSIGWPPTMRGAYPDYHTLLSDKPVFLKESDLKADQTYTDRLTNTKKTGITLKGVQNVVGRVKAAFPNIGKTEVLAKQADIPEEIIKSGGIESTDKVFAYYDPASDTIYVISENMNSPDAVIDAILHEGIGHRGIDAILTKENRRELFEMIERDYKDTDIGKKIIKDYRLDLGKLKDRVTFSREVIAHMTSKPKATLLDRVVAFIKDIIRKFRPSLKVTDSEIKSLLRRSAGFARVGQPDAAQETEPVFQMTTIDDLTKDLHGEITKKTKLAKRTEAEALAEGMIDEGWDSLVSYKTKPEWMKTQSEKAVKFVNENWEKAKKIALGEEAAPEGIEEGFIWKAVKLRAFANGDNDLVYQLATESGVPELGAKLGQRIKAFDDSSNTEDPEVAIREVGKFRKEKNKRQGKKTVSVKKIKELKEKLDEAEAKLREYEGQTSDVVIDKLIEKSPKKLYKKTNSKILKEQIKNSLDQGLSEISTDVQALAKYFITQGVTERNALVKEVHNVIKDIIPGITVRETMDAISGYGKFKPLSKDEVLVKLRDLKGQLQQVAKLEDMQKGKAPLKTGIERRTPSDEERRLIKQVEEMKKELGIETVDPEKQLKSSLDAVKTRLSNQIRDLEYQITTRQKIVKSKTNLKYDAETNRLLKQRDDLKKQFHEIFGSEITDQQRINAAIKATERAIIEYTRMISENDLTPKAKRTPVQSEELNKARKERDRLKAQIKELRNLPKRSPEEIATQRLETRLKNEVKKLTTKLETLDFKTGQRQEIVLGPEGRKLKAQRDDLKAALNAAVKASGVVTREEADRLIELSRILANARDKTEGYNSEYGAAKVAFLEYIDFLKGTDKPIKEMLTDEWEEVRTVWKDNKAKAFTKSIMDIINTVSDLSISLLATLDNSFLGRQGINTFFTHFPIWLRDSGKSFVDIYKTLESKHGGRMVKNAVMADAYSRPNYRSGDYDIAKLIPKTEEQFPTSIPERIPFAGRLFKASENAFTNSGIRMRIDTYDLLKRIAAAQGVDVKDKVWIQETGKLINSITARGDLGKLGSGGPLRLIFWAPKMLWGNINVLTAHFGGAGLKHPFARQQARKNLLKIVGLNVLVLAIIDAIGRLFGKDDVVEWNPVSSDFTKVKINDTRHDITAGKASIITLLARALTFRTKSTKTKRVTKLNSGKFGSKTLFDVIIDFMANKSAPLTKTAIDITRGRNFNYEKPGIGNVAYNLATPIGIQNFVETYQRADEFKDIPIEEIIADLLDLVGVNTSTYDSDAEMKKKYRELRRKSR